MHVRPSLRRVLLAVAIGTAALAVAVAGIAPLRWRVQLVALHLAGEIPDISLREVVEYSMPGSDQVMPQLLERRNPYAVIRNTRTAPADVSSGARIFLARCASCHGPDGRGSHAAPALVGREFKHGDSDWAVYRTVREGVSHTVMPPTPFLSEVERWQVISFVRSLAARHVAAVAGAARTLDVQTPYSSIAGSVRPAADWLTYSGSYNGTRHSSLTAITRANVDRLTLKWVHQVAGSPPLEVTPLVRNGTMFVSVPPCTVEALDAAAGHTLWSWQCTPKNDLGGEFGIVNRGVALLDDKVFYAAPDARLFAIDARTGKQAWVATVEEDATIYYITGAPLAFGDLVVTGTSTRQIGRAVIAAFDAKTGKERWRFHTVPGPGRRGHETWAGDSWRAGGGPVWLTGSYDPELDLLYWGVGNPKPDYDPDARKGDNLYTNSVVALRGSTGELAWHFQFVPADNRDWGANQIPVLVDYANAGREDKRLLWANRNGYYYVFDRTDGRYLLGKRFAQATWTPGLDARGRPLPLPGHAGNEGRLLYPGNVGATHWSSPTYYPPRDLMIVPVLEQGMVYFPSLSSPPRASGRAFYTAIRALNARTGELVWEHKRAPRLTGNFMPGLVSTAGGIVFGSDQSTFLALDAETGEVLWETETGGTVIANPITFAVNGEQFVTIAAGRDLLTFALPPERPKMAAKVPPT